jgi:hypothetical protein
LYILNERKGRGRKEGKGRKGREGLKVNILHKQYA